MRYDVVIAGGGTAGCVLAARLSEEPSRRICLVEAGPDYGRYTDGRWPEDILDGRILPLDSHCWEREDEEDRSQVRARILGGCSAHNACVVLRGVDADYDAWGPGWTARELAPYLDRAERMLGARPVMPGSAPWHRVWSEAFGGDTLDYLVNMTDDGVRDLAGRDRGATRRRLRRRLRVTRDPASDRHRRRWSAPGRRGALRPRRNGHRLGADRGVSARVGPVPRRRLGRDRPRTASWRTSVTPRCSARRSGGCATSAAASRWRGTPHASFVPAPT